MGVRGGRCFGVLQSNFTCYCLLPRQLSSYRARVKELRHGFAFMFSRIGNECIALSTRPSSQCQSKQLKLLSTSKHSQTLDYRVERKKKGDKVLVLRRYRSLGAIKRAGAMMRAFFISSRTTEGKVHPTALSILLCLVIIFLFALVEQSPSTLQYITQKQNSGSHWNRRLLAIHNGRRRSYIPPGGRPLQQVCRDDE
jgi:hypothetical protein